MKTAKFIVFALVAAIGVAGVSAANNGGAIGSNAGGGGGGGGGLDEATANGFYLRQDGTQTLKGNLLPDGNATRNVGATGSRLQQLWLERLNTSVASTAGQLTIGGNVNIGNANVDGLINLRNNLGSGNYLAIGSVGAAFFVVSVTGTARVVVNATKIEVCGTNSVACGLTATGTTHPEVRVTDDAGFCVTTNTGTTCNTTITGTGFVLEAQQSITIADSGDANPGFSSTGPTHNSISVTCNDTDGCTWNPGIGGAANGTRFCLSNVSANAVTISDGGLMVVQGASIALGQKDSACFHTVGGEFIQTSLSDN